MVVSYEPQRFWLGFRWVGSNTNLAKETEPSENLEEFSE